MASVDTNVLVRWLVDDDAPQVARIRKVFETAILRRETLFVSCTVVLELEWVLRSRYEFGKSTVLQAFNALLGTQELEFQAEAAIERAFHLYRDSNAEFADCLHAGICAAEGHMPLLTFDHKAAKLPGAQLIGA